MMEELQRTYCQLCVHEQETFVRGYEIEKTARPSKIYTRRDVETINAGVTNLDLGNFVRVTNAYNIPDIGDISGETTPYKTLKLFRTLL